MAEHALGCTVLGCTDGCPTGQEKFDAAVLLVEGADERRPFTGEELAHLLEIQVCGCDGSCATSKHCPQPVLDGIGADWIADHFEQLVETLVRGDRNARFVEKVREAFGKTTTWMIKFDAIEQAHRDIYNAPCKPVAVKE